VVGASLDLALPDEAIKGINEQLELMKSLIESLPKGEGEEGVALSELVTASRPAQVEGAGLRAFRALLLERDPHRRFGDLRRVLTPSGEYLWVCPSVHYPRYNPELPVLPTASSL
jgi:hypothetical protein